MKIARILAPSFVVVALSPALIDCQNIPKVPGVDVPAIPKCPDLSTVDAALGFDYAKEFSLQADGAAKLRAGVAGSLEMQGFAASIEGDLKGACAAIATDLGNAGPFKDSQAACDAAAKAITDTKNKIGASVRVAMTLTPPVCRAELKATADCFAKCDAKVTPGSVKMECEAGKLSGQCDAQCTGKCDLQASAKCDGECRGTCDADIKGSCSGTCNGKCDGKAGKAACAGVCEGKCEGGNVQATCSGKCDGNCKMNAAAKCDGTCTGSCSAEFKAPKCAGEVKAPEVSAECRAHCDTQVSAKAECSPAKVGIAISGGTDTKALALLKATLEKNLPRVLKVSIGMKDNAARVQANGTAAIDGVQASVSEIAKQAGARAAVVGGQITACLGGTFKGAADAAGSIRANVAVSVKVQASVSASGSAGGSAGAQ
jgi:hypothetical protein